MGGRARGAITAESVPMGGVVPAGRGLIGSLPTALGQAMPGGLFNLGGRCVTRRRRQVVAGLPHRRNDRDGWHPGLKFGHQPLGHLRDRCGRQLDRLRVVLTHRSVAENRTQLVGPTVITARARPRTNSLDGMIIGRRPLQLRIPAAEPVAEHDREAGQRSGVASEHRAHDHQHRYPPPEPHHAPCRAGEPGSSAPRSGHVLPAVP